MAVVKKGDTVRQILPAPVQGVVVGFNVDQETGDLLTLVQWEQDTNGDGDPDICQKYFRASEIEVVSL